MLFILNVPNGPFALLQTSKKRTILRPPRIHGTMASLVVWTLCPILYQKCAGKARPGPGGGCMDMTY
jgi:hypothetical protein